VSRSLSLIPHAAVVIVSTFGCRDIKIIFSSKLRKCLYEFQYATDVVKKEIKTLFIYLFPQTDLFISRKEPTKNTLRVVNISEPSAV
jgi:hypothetical protein